MNGKLKSLVNDTRFEPVARWLIKRSRGIRMPYALVKNEIYDRQAAKVIRRVMSEDANGVDIGCHRGQFLQLFLERAPRGAHFAFEPIPFLADALKKRFQSVQVFDYALSDKAGHATFYLVPDAPALSGLNRREFIRGHAKRQEIPVRIERLDALIPASTRIHLIKIDVEGAEGPVIAGAVDTIQRNRPVVIFEHGEASSLAFGTSSADLHDLLTERCGLAVWLLPDWLSGKRPLTKRQFCSQREWYFVAAPVEQR
jgi:FkbM family methyltransferase